MVRVGRRGSQEGRWWELENAVVMHHLGGEVTNATRGAGSLLLDVVGHDTVVFVDDMRLEAVALAVLNTAGSTDVGPLTCGRREREKLQLQVYAVLGEREGEESDRGRDRKRGRERKGERERERKIERDRDR